MCDVFPLLLVLKSTVFPPTLLSFHISPDISIGSMKNGLQQSVPATKGKQQTPVTLTNTL